MVVAVRAALVAVAQVLLLELREQQIRVVVAVAVLLLVDHLLKMVWAAAAV